MVRRHAGLEETEGEIRSGGMRLTAKRMAGIPMREKFFDGRCPECGWPYMNRKRRSYVCPNCDHLKWVEYERVDDAD